MAKVTGEINMDIAKQSTSQEILEKLEKNEQPILKYLSVTTTEKNATPINITGKGRLYFGQLINSNAYSTTSTLKLYIDGNLIINGSYTTTGAGSSTYNIANKDFISGVYGNSAYTAYYFGGYVLENLRGSNVELNYDSRETLTASSGFYINGYIPFNESLKIVITSAGTETQSICYSLDEE